MKASLPETLVALQRRLKDRSYKPGPIKRHGWPRTTVNNTALGVPNVIDRIVQMALLLLLQPIFETDFDEGSFGYRSGRDARQTMEAIRTEMRRGRTEVIDADLSANFTPSTTPDSRV